MRKRRVTLQTAPVLPWETVASVAGIETFRASSGPDRIYFARAATGQIKIGCANNPGWRVHKQTLPGDRWYCGNHGIDTSTFTLLLVVAPGGWGRESALHRAFAEEKATRFGPREWFSGPRIEACVAALLARSSGKAAA